jgi:hypothetical protein
MVVDTAAERTILADSRNIEQPCNLTVGGQTFLAFHVFLVPTRARELATLKVDGILGQDFLRQFSSVRIDYRTNTITLVL